MLKHIPETYEIIGKIGSGKSGDVYKAYHKNLRTYVVLKKVKTELRNLVNNRAEVDVLKNLRHSGLPQVYDFGRRCVYCYDFCRGKQFWTVSGQRQRI